MKLVTCMGGVWKLTDAKYKSLVQYIAAGGQDYLLDDYGTQIGSVDLGVTDADESLVYTCRMNVPGYREYDEFQKAKAKVGLKP